MSRHVTTSVTFGFAGGLAYLTANSIIFAIELIIGAFPSGFGSTTSMLIEVEKGKRGERAVTQLCLRIVNLSVIVNIIQIVLVFLLAKPLVTLFSPETAEVAQLSVWGLRIYVLSVVAGLLLIATAPIRYIWLCFVIGQGLCLIITWFTVNGKLRHHQHVWVKSGLSHGS